MSNELLEYPQRHYGMDHDRYEWSMLQDREPVTWPGGKPGAVDQYFGAALPVPVTVRSRHPAH